MHSRVGYGATISQLIYMILLMVTGGIKWQFYLVKKTCLHEIDDQFDGHPHPSCLDDQQKNISFYCHQIFH